MYIEIKGTNHKNKGAELMLRCVLQELESWSPSPSPVVSPRIGPYPWRARMGLYQKLTPARLVRPGWPDPAGVVPRRARTAFGLVPDSEIDAIFDASGFAYGAQWGPRSTLRLAQATRQWRLSGKRSVMLPQAFGPFEGVAMRDAFLRVSENVDLIFARDAVSYSAVLDLGVPKTKVRKSPDFTIAIKGCPPRDLRLGERPVAIVPNTKIIEKGVAESEPYRALLGRCVASLRTLGLTPFLLAHDSGHDLDLARSLAISLGGGLAVVHREDPIELKGMIGACELLIGSRYHAIVAALTQNVPALVIGWSHKYGELLAEYGCGENMIPVTATTAEIQATVEPLLDPAVRTELVARLESTNGLYRAAVAEMWSQVRAVVQPDGGG